MNRYYYYGDKDVFKYRGYIYCPEDEITEDNSKRYHRVFVEVKGIRIEVDSVPLSPYTLLTEGRFQRWIQAGKPNRERLGGHYDEDHDRYWRKLFDEALDNILLGKDEDSSL